MKKNTYNYREIRGVEDDINKKDDKTIIKSGKHDSNYAIVDKKNQKIEVFNKDGELLYDSKVQTGASGEDFNTITYVDNNGHIINHAGNDSTPAGITRISYKGKYKGRACFVRSRYNSSTGKWDDNLATSMHFERIDNKGSNGCVRLPGKSGDELSKYLNAGDFVYTLPQKEGSKFVLKEGSLNFIAENPYGKTEGDKKYWDDYNVHIDKTYRPIDIDYRNSDIDIDNSDETFMESLERMYYNQEPIKQIKNENIKEYIKGIEDSKESLMKEFDIDSSTYNKFAEYALGIAEQESKFGVSAKHSVKEMFPDEHIESMKRISNAYESLKDGDYSEALDYIQGDKTVSHRSRGITKIKIDGDNKETQAIYKKYGINKDSLDDVKNAATGTMIRLLSIYKNEVLGRDFRDVDGNPVDSGDIVLYKYSGQNKPIRNNDLTPDKNIYLNNVKKYAKNFSIKTTFKDGGEFELEGGDDFLKGLYSSDLKRVMNGERAVYFGHLNDKPLINEYPEFMGRIPIKKGPSSIVSNAVTEDAEDVFYKTAKGVFSFLDLPNKIGKKINRFGKKVEESIRPDHSEMEKFARGFVGRLIKIFGKRREMWPGLFVPGEYYENKEDADMAQSFSDAFRDAENKGLKEFEWNGERYKVERKEDGGKVSSELDITPSEKRIREIVNMVNGSDANFVKRLKQKNRAYLNDWEHEGSIATHKMAVEIDEDGKTYMYPMVQEINGYLHDFTNPRYNAGNFDALRWAKKNNDVVEFDDILEALWFSENYKDLGIYPKFENGGPVSEKSTKQNLKEERETRDWISGWLEARKDILGKNTRVDEEFESPSSKSDLEFGEDEYKRQMGQYDSIDRINYDVNGLPADESKREFLRATVRDYTGNNIEDDKLLNDELKQMFEGFVSSSDSDDRFLYYPNYPTENIRTHENTHALAYRDPVYGPSTAQSRRIADRMNTKESLIEGVEYDDYMDDANEIYSRLMEFRRENNLDPKKKYTKDDIKSFREKYKNKNDDNDSYGVIDRYNDDFLLFLLNDIAYNKNSGDSDIQYAETGGLGGSRWLNDAAYRDSISTERDRYHQERIKRIEDGKPVDINYTIKGSSNGDVDREVALVMNSLKQNINDKTLSSGLREALEKIEEDRKEKVGDAKRNVNSVLAGVSLLGALYGIAPGWMNMKFGLDPKKAQLISSSVGLGTDLGQLSLADSDFEKYENSIESAGDLAGIIGSTDVMQRIGRYGPVVDAILDKYGRSAALYDLVKAPYEIYTNVAESIKKYGGIVKMNPGGDIKEKVKLLYDKLKGDAGMSDILALGVIGNLWHESGGLNEEAVGDTNTSDHAYGIQQWRGERKNKLFEFAKNRGHEKPTYEDEVDFLIEEFNTGNGGFLYGDKGKSSKAGYYNYSKSDFLQSGSLSDAVVSWNLGSGRPHKDFIANDSRLKYAEAAAKILGVKIPESESYYGNQGYNPDGVDMRTYMAQTSEEPATFNINITAEKEDNSFDDWMNTYGKEMIASMYARQNEADEKSAEEERLKKAMKEEEERTKAEQAEKRQREALIAAILPNLQLSIKGMSRTES